MRIYDIIKKKRDGGILSGDEIRFFVDNFTSGAIPDYQASALMMAIYFRGMNKEETVELTRAMVHSGEIIDLSPIQGKKVDKHSTGGVGDKTSIVLGPLVAATGVPVAKLSGRGLGHTGGTIDKLESFPGFSVEMTNQEFIHNVNTVGIAMGGQTADLAPADKKIYALRDVTATVENLSLIAGSIMSKKLASGADAIVLDVKCGCGAFMKNEKDAREVAQAMVDIGEGMGKRTVALITDMEQPLGFAVGNAIEVKEAISTLRGEGPEDLLNICLELGSRMMILADAAPDTETAKLKLREAISNGSAFNKLKEFIASQGGDASYVDSPEKLPLGEFSLEILAPQTGYIAELKADDVGLASMLLGAGRETKEDQIDLGAGILLTRKYGNPVQKGEIVATLFANDKAKLEVAARKLNEAIIYSETPPGFRPLVIGEIGKL